ncbi:hypothetical protein D915_010746 [Fasciola hepatica]|uniref:Uncharacterized protein n=1 Tax=Fasciola hepatica TaxID=6192 RepID=A0A4E0QUK1_FASHE|nr:hypothetical protein D915_010746 [Fasciola hepatica]
MVSEKLREPRSSLGMNTSRTFAISPPDSLNMQSQNRLEDEWRLWRQRYQDFAVLTHLDSESKECQMAMLRHCLGGEARRVWVCMTRRLIALERHEYYHTDGFSYAKIK